MISRTTQFGHLRRFSGTSRELTRLGDAIVRGVLALFSFEFVLAAFLFSGSYKEDPRFEWIGIDLMILLGSISFAQGALITGLRINTIHRKGIPCLLAGAAFCLYAFLSTHWSLSDDYAMQKALRLCTINLWCLFAGCIIIAASRRRVLRLANSITMVSCWFSVECLLFYSDRLGGDPVYKVDVLAGDGGYIGLGRAAAAGAVLVGARLLADFRTTPLGRTSSHAVFSLPLFAFLILSTMLLGAKGPLVAAIMALGITFLSVSWSLGLRRRSKAIVLAIAAVAGIVVMTIVTQIYLGDMPLTVRRLLAFSASSEYYDPSGSGYVRIDLVRSGLELWYEEPFFGWGLGSFSILDGAHDARHHCHNLIAEILCELGIVGLLFAASTFWLAHRSARGPGCEARYMMFAFFIYGLANSFVSGDLPDNRLLFLATGLLAYQGRGLADQIAARR